ncbi:unnamed protein product [Merluccius merluccius]
MWRSYAHPFPHQHHRDLLRFHTHPVPDQHHRDPLWTPRHPVPLVLEHRGLSGGRTSSLPQHLRRPAQLMRTQRSPLRWRPTMRRTRTESQPTTAEQRQTQSEEQCEPGGGENRAQNALFGEKCCGFWRRI